MQVDGTGVVHHLTRLAHVGGAEVDDYIHDEQYIHQHVQHTQRVTSVTTFVDLFTHIQVFVQMERGRIWCEHSRVQDQDQDDPIPECLEGAVVKQDEPCCLWNLQFVFWQHIRLQGKDL